jgi:hypothetical protein
MTCESIIAGGLAAALSLVIREYFHVPAVGVWLSQRGHTLMAHASVSDRCGFLLENIRGRLQAAVIPKGGNAVLFITRARSRPTQRRCHGL